MQHCYCQLKKEKNIHSSLRSLLFYLSIEHKVLCTTLYIFNYNDIFVTAV